MSALVPHQLPRILAGACIGGHSRQVDRSRQILDGHDELGSHHLFGCASDFVIHEECETPVSPADALDMSQPSAEHVRYPERFDHIAHFVSSLAPRERALATYER